METIRQKIINPIKARIQARPTMRDVSILLVLLGIWLRGRGLTSPLWYDEAFSINLARLPLPSLIRATWLDFTPPLHYLIIKPFIWISNAPWMARIPSLLASIMTLAVIWEMLDDWQVTENQRLWISALTLLPGFYWMAQDARAYAMLSLLYLLSFWLLMGGQYRWAAVTMALMCWSHALGLILAISLVLVNLIRDWYLLGLLNTRKIYKSLARKTITAGLVGILAGLPGLMPILLGKEAGNFLDMPLSLGQLSNSIITTMFVETVQGPAEILAYIVVLLYLLLSLMIMLLAINEWSQQLRSGETAERIDDDVVVTTGLLVLIPAVLLIVASMLGSSIVFYRTWMPLLYPLIMWIGSATAIQEYKPIKLIMPSLLAAILIISLIGWSPRIKGSDLDRAAAMINRDPGPVLYATGTVALPFDLYVDEPGWIATAEQYPTMLGQPEIMTLLGWKYRDPGPWAKWIIWPQEQLIPDSLAAELEQITADDYELAGIVEYWQIGDSEIWRAK